MRTARRLRLGIALILLWIAPAWGAAPPSTRPATTQAQTRDLQFMRFVEDGAAGASLETADITFQNAAGVQVRLVAAVHIGDTAYFQELNRGFVAADAVLYEMVKPKGAPPPLPGQSGDSGVARFQRFLKDTLGLDYQLDVIDYRAPNFVHADLDAETFQRMQSQRGESFATLMLRQMLDALTNPPAGAADPTDDLQGVVDLLTRPDMRTQLKLAIARQLGDMERIAAGLNGPDGSVILTERNKAAFGVLRRQMADGKKRLAIFYGAAHMPDLADRLETAGFVPVRTDWHRAWDLTIHADRPSAIETLLHGAVDAMQRPQE